MGCADLVLIAAVGGTALGALGAVIAVVVAELTADRWPGEPCGPDVDDTAW